MIAWHDALNDGDADRLASLCSEDVEVGGPGGSGRGQQLLRDWFSTTGVRLELTAFLRRGEVVVVSQEAVWGSGTPAQVASVFRVREGLIVSVTRHDSIDSALIAGGINKR